MSLANTDPMAKCYAGYGYKLTRKKPNLQTKSREGGEAKIRQQGLWGKGNVNGPIGA